MPRVTTIDMVLLHSSSQGFAHTSFYWDPSLVDVHNFAALCDQYGLSVVPPSALPKAESPVLTLDRDCLSGEKDVESRAKSKVQSEDRLGK